MLGGSRRHRQTAVDSRGQSQSLQRCARTSTDTVRWRMLWRRLLRLTTDPSAQRVEVDSEGEGVSRLEDAGDFTTVAVAKLGQELTVDQGHRIIEVHDPVPLDPSIRILPALDDVIHPSRSRRNDLNDEQKFLRTQNPTLGFDAITR